MLAPLQGVLADLRVPASFVRLVQIGGMHPPSARPHPSDWPMSRVGEDAPPRG